ncbi:MAG: flagellar type III secretion system pore protein FliP [Spirochaetales bacterium]|nr:flagellar type III secretion system pore protein FliP [Spirochaetales bacterium]
MKRKFWGILGLVLVLGGVPVGTVYAQQRVVQTSTGLGLPFVDINLRPAHGSKETALSVQLLVLLTALSLAPSLLILMTGFLRISIVLDFVKRALGLQQVPPNQVMLGIALFLTLFIQFPVFQQIYNDAYMPYTKGTINTTEFLQKAESPLRYFMFRQMGTNNFSDIKLFMRLSNLPKPENMSQVPTYVLVPAFILHEMTVAFKIGILIYIPFLIIDMVVASVLMAMGMIMLPPVLISAPFKLILFVMVDGWTLLTMGLVKSFNM